MASEDRRSIGGQDNGVDGQGERASPQEGPPRDRLFVAVDAENLASMLASHAQLHEAAEEHMAASSREQELLSRVNARLEQQVIVLQQQVAILSSHLSLRYRESPEAPGEDGKPL